VGVVLAFQSEHRWTLIGTRQTIGVLDGQPRSFSHSKISDIHPKDYPPPVEKWDESTFEKMAREKRSWDILILADDRGREEFFWVPPGPEAFTMWSLQFMISRLHN
jgi:hypothetical protein